MDKPRMAYFEQEDVLHLAISEEPEAQSVELSPDITVELNDKGELIGIEILHASTFLRDSIVESVQAKLLGVTSTGSGSPR
ncbi:MAG: DUF2283 domain-containing protein [Candidatus Aureabacteria bacterium]|jgi:uncharacterized protein YuzE|nr:DUF2283 domain-containing protein [Candidatus Auribacterota bacterium]